ncbi:MAG: FecR domain-containing protein [Candidatus Accumulibacter phosphatis]
MHTLLHTTSRPGSARRSMHVLLLLLAMLFTTAAQAQEWHYTVRPGDNLWDVSTRYLSVVDYWPKLQALNGVTDPEHLPPGTRLRIPVAWLKRLPAKALVLAVQGQAQALIASTRKRVAVDPGLFLHQGDILGTGPDSNVTLKFADGSRVLLQADSELRLAILNARGQTPFVETRSRLEKGRADSEVTPRTTGAGNRYEIWTPAAHSAVRGTRYRISMDPATATSRLEVLEGLVELQGGRKTRSIPKGFGTLAETGKPPLVPVALLPPPTLGELPPLVSRVPIRWSFPTVPEAAAYRAQVAPNEQFDLLVFDAVSSTSAIRGPDLPDGNYVLRIRGIDARGLEGNDAEHRFRLHARPEPPILVRPPHQSGVVEKPLLFEWSEPQGAASYLFQLANDERFLTPLLKQDDHRQSRLTVEQPLEPGQYFWRVAVRDPTGREGPFSDPQAFRLQAAAQMQPPELAADRLTFRWGTAAPGLQYDFQLARDVDFTILELESRVSEAQVSLPRPDSGVYYLRVRTIEADGYVGPYGPVQRIELPSRNYWPAALVILLALVLIF